MKMDGVYSLHMPVRFLIPALVALVTSSCELPWNVTDYEPYSAYTHRTLTLKRPAFLYKTDLGIYLGVHQDSDNDLERGVHFANNVTPERRAAVLAYEKARHPKPPHIAELPVGTRLWIHKVMRLKDIEGGGFNVDAFGEVEVPGQAQPVRFDYHWGYDHIGRAPWEDDSVPLLRPAGYYGKRRE